MKKGIFITFEGNEGCGKTTASKRLYQELLQAGYKCIYTREPGGIDIAEQIREVILDTKNTKMDARCEALLYAAARRQHLIEKVIPALKQGNIVICDRFLDSSLAYQGIARGLGFEQIYKINEFAIAQCMPNKTFLLRASVEVGMQRVASRKEDMNRLDKENMEFHQRVAMGYDAVAKKFKERIVVIDANQNEEAVYQEIWKRTLQEVGSYVCR
ncbi:MAG: dTMP kinase [Breznakia sp.]